MSLAKAQRATSPWQRTVAMIRWLQSVEVGGGTRTPETTRIPPAKLADLLRLLLMLLQNGLSLPKSLQALCDDRAARKWLPVLSRMTAAVRQGHSLSDAMGRFPRTFTPIQIQQIRIGERTGEMRRSLEQVCQSIERRVAMRRKIIKKVSYPIMVMVAGFGLVGFMMTYVVPQFEQVFHESNVSLPAVTRYVSATSRAMVSFGPWLLLGCTLLGGQLLLLRSKPRGRVWIDSMLLRVPILGVWLRDAAALQFTDGIMSMTESGFTPAEAVEAAVMSVRNAACRDAAKEVCLAVRRGERLSKEMERHEDLFPSTLRQLIRVGEQTGDFHTAMSGACRHLQHQIDRRIEATVSLIEPVLTLGLAAIIGTVVMSIYLPMFHMFEVLE